MRISDWSSDVCSSDLGTVPGLRATARTIILHGTRPLLIACRFRKKNMAVTPPENEPIVRRKLADEVFDRLKAMIVSGERSPGESLPSERELMARFGVGRPAIREAMQAPANLGLVTISHGERARRREIGARDRKRAVGGKRVE